MASGDLGQEAYAFADFLEAAGQSVWQVLPLGPTGYGDSPYACYSAFAGNTLLISPEQLLSDGLLEKEALDHEARFVDDRINFEAVHQFKESILRRAFASFQRDSDPKLRDAFVEFCARQASWLEDYAMFRALKDAHGGAAWNEWEPALVRRDGAAIAASKQNLSNEIEAQKFYQFLFFRQWFTLKANCKQRGIKLIGDIPIFVAHDSADVWTNPEEFQLDKNGTPIVVAGVPPDYFSTTGQLWGNPLYNWDRMLADGLGGGSARATLDTYDIARIDHFRGFAACWKSLAATRPRSAVVGWSAGKGTIHCHQGSARRVAHNCRGPRRDHA